ncbi:hypothetical protein BGZ63DRAFT_377941, partial [Mariannaea sp. PMI_226]
MFGGSKRRRPPVQPLTRETANPNAATAAASAFARREPSVSLSSAAAAAALRARPTTPTNVAQVQSKRAMRRSASVSSTGSRDRGRKELQRSPSTSSMTERTFRSPSPGHGTVPRSNDIDVPPVPSLPRDEHHQSETTSSNHQRSSSLQIQPFRTASQKMKDGQGTGSWFGGAKTGDLSHVRRTDGLLDKRRSDERASSPSSSINFSYPRSQSETGLDRVASVGEDHTLVYDANSRRMIPRSELYMREQTVRHASEKPVKKKKNNASRGGSHLARGNTNRLKETAVLNPSTPPSPPPQQREAEGMAVVAKQVHDEDLQQTLEPSVNQLPPPVAKEPELQQQEYEMDSESGLESESEADEPQETKHVEVIVPQSDDTEARLPVVDEYPELKDESSQPEEIPQHREATTAIESPPQNSALVKRDLSQDQQSQIQAQTEAEKPTVPSQRTRVHSESPARTPRFAATTDQLVVRHEPPPRSLSPRKSAMKHRSPTRNASPSEDGSEASSAIMSLYSQEDTSLARRKSVRVSFDDQSNVVVGESAGTPEHETQLPSPQNKKLWHSVIARAKRDSVNLEDDEKMAPRPTLPSFGSVREKKTRDLEERPLVRPSERAWAPSLTSPTSTPPVDLGQSTDVAIGSLLAQEQLSRNAANISSISSDDESEPENSAVHETSETLQSQPATDITSVENAPVSRHSDTDSDETIPMISISESSPRARDKIQSEAPETFFDLPGDFPGEEPMPEPDYSRIATFDDAQRVENKTATEATSSKHLPPISTSRSEPVVASPPSPLIHDIQEEEEEEESEGESIYSDAYEDLSEFEGDGFMSLDAIVDGPVITVPKKLPENIIAKSKEIDTAKFATSTDIATYEHSQTKDDWENAKAYWKSLSIEKRRQLELEAMEEAGEEADLDEVPQPPKKTKKRTSLEKPRTQIQAQEKVVTEKPCHSDRVYQIQPGTSWPAMEDDAFGVRKASTSNGTTLKKSLRAEEQLPKATQASSMRKSMRSSGAPATGSQDGRLRKSLRTGTETAGVELRNGAAVEAKPLASYQPISNTEQFQKSKRSISADRAMSTFTSGTALKPSLRRRGSDSSESSFRRTRAGAGEGLGFNKTMRSGVRGSGAFSDSGRGGSRFSLRSLSPAGSNFRNSGTMSPTPMATSGRMRHSLRSNSSDHGSARLIPSFGRAAASKKSKKGGSRFADSSDEEDARPSFRSRFVDSSDEDDDHSYRAKGNGVARPMHKKASSNAAAAAMGLHQVQRAEDDSPELPDSDDENDPVSHNGAPVRSPNSQISGAGQSTRTRRGSFMSILRRKKDGAGKISRSLNESAARRDTRLERSTEELAAVRNVNNQHSARLHKRDPNWPLGDGQVDNHQNDEGFEDDESNTYVNEDKRPSTASGATPSLPTSPIKQGVLKRRSTSQGALAGQSHGEDVIAPVPDERSMGHEIPDIHKKKKFGTLRKMFGLH